MDIPANTPWRHFYEREGFTAALLTDGADNEEKLPDVLYRWSPPGSPVCLTRRVTKFHPQPYRPQLTDLALSRRGVLLGAVALAACAPSVQSMAGPDRYAASSWRKLTAADWQKRLPAASFDVLRNEGTERAVLQPAAERASQGDLRLSWLRPALI